MDLYAFAQIDELDKLAKLNNIDVPRLRGYRLMKDEEKIDINKFLKEEKNWIETWCVKDLCQSEPFWNPYSDVHCFNSYTHYLCRLFIKNYNKDDASVNWSIIHGKKRKVLKKMIHDYKSRAIKQFEVFNKYVGRNDVLFIHARIGGNNWRYYHQDIYNKDWFIEKVDDYFDSSYCDIFAKLNRLEGQ